MTHVKYHSCDVRGDGIIHGGTRFRIETMSAEKIRIKPDSPLELNSRVTLDLTLDGVLYEVNISCHGVVSLIQDNICDISLKGLTKKDKSEIEDIMRSSCDLE